MAEKAVKAEKAEKAVKYELLEGKVATLYLEGWQKRMLKDFDRSLALNAEHSRFVIDFHIGKLHLNTYRVPVIDLEDEGWEMYFTDAQKAYLQDVTGLKVVDSMRITKAMFAEKIITVR